MEQLQQKGNFMFKHLSSKTFIFSQLLLLFAGITGILLLHYKLNLEFKPQTAVYSSTGKPVTVAPATLTLEVTSPDIDLLTFQSSIVVSGQTIPDTTVLISNQDQNKILQSEFDGSFSTVLELNPGVNDIAVAVFNKNGDQRTINRTVYYSEEKI